jgi:hypothetical protein
MYYFKFNQFCLSDLVVTMSRRYLLFNSLVKNEAVTSTLLASVSLKGLNFTHCTVS